LPIRSGWGIGTPAEVDARYGDHRLSLLEEHAEEITACFLRYQISSSKERAMQWVCNVCGYVHDDDERPASCPVCGTLGAKFSEYFEDDEQDIAGGKHGMDDFDRDLFADYEDE
jgi:rubredoxin